MLTSSVNVVQSSFPDKDQGEISGLSRSVSNLGSSLGTALVGSVLVAVKLPEGRPFAVALTMMLVITLIGLVIALLIPRRPVGGSEPASAGGAPAPETLGSQALQPRPTNAAEIGRRNSRVRLPRESGAAPRRRTASTCGLLFCGSPQAKSGPVDGCR
jgi:hypothetical protein